VDILDPEKEIELSTSPSIQIISLGPLHRIHRRLKPGMSRTSSVIQVEGVRSSPLQEPGCGHAIRVEVVDAAKARRHIVASNPIAVLVTLALKLHVIHHHDDTLLGEKLRADNPVRRNSSGILDNGVTTLQLGLECVTFFLQPWIRASADGVVEGSLNRSWKTARVRAFEIAVR
jgi:hypothetical protein